MMMIYQLIGKNIITKISSDNENKSSCKSKEFHVI
jgi:hypothetical protein